MSKENLDTEFLEESPSKKDNSLTVLFLLIMATLFIIALFSLFPIFYLYNVDNVDYSYVGLSILCYTVCITFGIFAGINGLTDVEHTEMMGKKNIKIKKALVAFLSAIPIISSFCFGAAISSKTLLGSNDYNSTSRILRTSTLDGYKVIPNKVSDYNFTNRPKILAPSADDILFHKRTEDELLEGLRINKNLDAPLLLKSHKNKKTESEPQPINININLTINIPSVDKSTEQKMPLKIELDKEMLNRNLNIERGLREMMDAGEISRETQSIDRDVHVDYPPTVDYKKEFEKKIEERREKLLDELEKRKNKILNDRLYEFEQERRKLNDLKEELRDNRFLFPEPSDNRFGER